MRACALNAFRRERSYAPFWVFFLRWAPDPITAIYPLAGLGDGGTLLVARDMDSGRPLHR